MIEKESFYFSGGLSAGVGKIFDGKLMGLIKRNLSILFGEGNGVFT